ncbi:TPA: hypothetical protein N6931_000585, partial [Escherichia coli]
VNSLINNSNGMFLSALHYFFAIVNYSVNYGNDEAQRENPAIFPYFQSCDRMSLMMLITLTLQNGPYERI